MVVNVLGENKCEIDMENGTGRYLQSYKSIVAKKCFGEITLYPKWDYSRTTAKHVGQWLGISCKEIREKIKQGDIKVEQYEPEL